MDLSQVKIAGPQLITFGGLDLGHTLDGVTLKYDRTFTDVNVDKYGTMIVDKVLSGANLSVTFKMAQDSWRQWRAALPESSSVDGTGTADRTDFGVDAGASLRSLAGALNIHPLRKALSDQTEDINIYKAVSSEPIEVPFTIDGQKVIEVTLTALVDETYGTGRRLGHIGASAVS